MVIERNHVIKNNNSRCTKYFTPTDKLLIIDDKHLYVLNHSVKNIVEIIELHNKEHPIITQLTKNSLKTTSKHTTKYFSYQSQILRVSNKDHNFPTVAKYHDRISIPQ